MGSYWSEVPDLYAFELLSQEMLVDMDLPGKKSVVVMCVIDPVVDEPCNSLYCWKRRTWCLNCWSLFSTIQF
jgi:hypothetical protein